MALNRATFNPLRGLDFVSGELKQLFTPSTSVWDQSFIRGRERFGPECEVSKKIWRAEIHYRWKLLGCLLCKEEDVENTLHMFRDCAAWFGSPWGLKHSDPRGGNWRLRIRQNLSFSVQFWLTQSGTFETLYFMSPVVCDWSGSHQIVARRANGMMVTIKTKKAICSSPLEAELACFLVFLNFIQVRFLGDVTNLLTRLLSGQCVMTVLVFSQLGLFPRSFGTVFEWSKSLLLKTKTKKTDCSL